MTTMRQIQLTEWGDENVLHEANVLIPRRCAVTCSSRRLPPV